MDEMEKKNIILSKLIVNNCFRNTQLEDLHAGITPSSKTGDYTDVKVVSPYGEIPWKNLSRISDVEMKSLMKECVNELFDLLTELNANVDLDPIKVRLTFQFPHNWDDPE